MTPHVNLYMTPYGDVRVSDIEAMILTVSYDHEKRGSPRTRSAQAIHDACVRVAKWKMERGA